MSVIIKIKHEDFTTLKRILGDMYLENGNIEEVVLLSKVIDKIIVSMQVSKKEYQKDNNDKKTLGVGGKN
ncbi:MAG: hypothetical protein NSGCLCUN01_02312 [uncultured Clostridium sp.]